MRPKTITLAIVCVVAIVGLFGPGRQPSSGQEQNFPESNRKPACSCYCGGSTPEYFNLFDMGDVMAGKCFGGPLPSDQCGDALKSLPEEKQKSFCAKVKTWGTYNSSCPAAKTLAQYCEEKQPTGAKCEPPPPENNNPPWLNEDLPCDNRQRATISWSQSRASNMDVSFTVDMCGKVIRYIYPGGGTPERTPPGVRSFDVCCDSWRNAADTGSPCDARRDIDCDGTLNESDQMPEYAFREPRPDDFVSNSPLSNMPFWKKLHEPVRTGCKDCKWELVRVEYTCKNVADPVRSANRAGMVFDATYNYQATWKCPSSGQTQETRDTVTMVDLRCPTPPNRSWP